MMQDKEKSLITLTDQSSCDKGTNVGNTPVFFCPSIIAHLFIGGNYYEKKN
ncbi:hypothetical protein ABW365_20795 [Enterococcus avium]